MMTTETIEPQSRMREVLEACPGAQRALFRRYHIGGCASCGFQPEETLEQVCQRNGVEVNEALDHIKTSHEQDAKIFILPQELSGLLKSGEPVKLLDVRSRAEFDAARIEGSVLLSHPVMQEIMSQWPRNTLLVIIDHKGRQALDAAAYFMGHGFENVRALRGGIDAWSQAVDSTVPQYDLA